VHLKQGLHYTLPWLARHYLTSVNGSTYPLSKDPSFLYDPKKMYINVCNALSLHAPVQVGVTLLPCLCSKDVSCFMRSMGNFSRVCWLERGHFLCRAWEPGGLLLCRVWIERVLLLCRLPVSLSLTYVSNLGKSISRMWTTWLSIPVETWGKRESKQPVQKFIPSSPGHDKARDLLRQAASE